MKGTPSKASVALHSTSMVLDRGRGVPAVGGVRAVAGKEQREQIGKGSQPIAVGCPTNNSGHQVIGMGVVREIFFEPSLLLIC